MNKKHQEQESEEFFNRLRELSGVEYKKEKPLLEQEDDLNYYIFELLNYGEMDGQSSSTGSGYTGEINIYIKSNDLDGKYSVDDILKSIKFEKNIYKNTNFSEEYYDNTDINIKDD